MRQWRLIYDNHAVGAWNMAVDEAILESVGNGLSLPTLRLYGWHPACISLGYGQRASDVDFVRLQQYGWDVVRRSTGGRAILHTDELTYSLALPIDHELGRGTVIESYRRISAALVSALVTLGIVTQANRIAERGKNGPVCFETPSHYEITVAGRKLVGSAQMRRKQAILQHGSLPLKGDITRICNVLRFSSQSEREASRMQVSNRAVTIAEVLGFEPDWSDVANAIAQGFVNTFNVDFAETSTQLPEPASLRAKQLLIDVYGTTAWTNRR